MTNAAATKRKEPSRRARPAYHPLVIVTAAVCAGMLFDRFAPLGIRAGLIAWWLAAGAGLALWLVAWLLKRDRIATFALLFSLAALGGGWHHHRWCLFPENDLANFARGGSQPVALEAIALSEPRIIPAPPREPLRAIPSGDRSRMDVEIVSVRDGRAWRPAAGRSRLTVDGHLLGVHAGDRLTVFAQLAKTDSPRNPGEIDFAAHARADRRRSVLNTSYPDCVTVSERAATWSAAGAIDRLRLRGDRLLREYVSPDQSGLAAALILGSRDQLDLERIETFMRTNTIHFLAISGLHVAVMAGCLFVGLRWGWMPRRWALAAVVAATITYTLITDAPPSAVRAAAIIVLICGAMWCGRPCLPLNCLAAAALLVLALNPADLFRTGPQLSFLAVAVLCLLGPHWSKLRDRDALDRLVERTRPLPQRLSTWLLRWWWRATLITAAVWAATLPLIVERFHLVAPIAILLSPVLAPLVAVALMSGLAVLLTGWLAPPVAKLFGMLCGASLESIDTLVAWGDSLPLSHFWVPSPALWLLALFYVGLAIWAASPHRRPGWRVGVAVVVVWITAAIAGLWSLRRPSDDLECAFLSVGHGCCVVLHLPDGGTMLYDAGKLGSPSGAAHSVAQYLWSRGITRLDAVVVSHADVDHFNALPNLAERIRIDAVYVAPRMSRDMALGEDESLAVLNAALDRHAIALRTLSQGDDLQKGDCRIHVLHPQPEGVSGSDNANSLVLLVECCGRRLLLPGDLEREGIRRLLAQSPVDCDVLLAPHHGSAHSNPPGFSRHFAPEWVIISGGRTQTSDQVVASFAFAGAEVLHTTDQGAVQVVIDGGGGLTVTPIGRPPP